MPAYCTVQGTRGILRNGFLEIIIDYGLKEFERASIRNKLTGEEFVFAFQPVQAWFSDELSDLKPLSHTLDARGSMDLASLRVRLDFGQFDADITYVLQRGNHFFSKHIVFHNVRQSQHLRKVSLYRHRLLTPASIILHDGGMYYPVVFVRGRLGSLFYSGDYPGYFADIQDAEFGFSYYPGEDLRPGRSFQTLGAHIGITCHAGRTRSNPYHETGAALDVGEQQWFREYLQLGMTPDGLPRVELKAPGPGCTGPSELEVLDQCVNLGAHHVLLPEFLRAPDSSPLAESLREQLRAHGLSATLLPLDFGPPDLRTVALTEAGRPAQNGFSPCLASEDYVQRVLDQYLGLIERHGFGDAEVNGAPIIACNSMGHGHSPGLESIQKAFQGLVDIAAALRQECGHVQCSGPYGSYGAGITRLFDSVPLLAHAHPLPLPDIHVARLFADMNRLYFRRSHDFLVPKSRLSSVIGVAPEACPDAPYPGTEYFPWYEYGDSAGWRYSVISALATGLRHRIHALPRDLSPEDIEFTREWLRWEEEHTSDLIECEEVLDEPGMNAVDGYCYATPRGALLFAFNTGYERRDVNCELHLTHDAEYVIRELYPHPYNYLGPNDGLFASNSRLTMSMGPKEARVIEVVRRSPASAKRKRPELFGAECRDEAGFFGVVAEPGERLAVGVRSRNRYQLHDVRMPGRPITRTITEWSWVQRGFEDGQQRLPHQEFAGKPLGTAAAARNVFLQGHYLAPSELAGHIDTTPFSLAKPCWAYPKRLFFVVRFEPASAFQPILTSSVVPGVPEAFHEGLSLKCGIDLSGQNLGIHAWVNGVPRDVYPALAAWVGFVPNHLPVVAYFFEAGSTLDLGKRNRITLFVRTFDPATFRGIAIEHLPDLRVTKGISVT